MHSFDRERQARVMEVAALLATLSPDKIQEVEASLRAAQPTVDYKVCQQGMLDLGCPPRLIRTIWYNLVQDMEDEARWLLGQPSRRDVFDGRDKETFVRRCLATPLPVSVLLKATYIANVGETTWGYFEEWRKGLVT